MNKWQIIHVLLFVCMISSGQVFFKKAGLEVRESGTWFTWRNVILLGTAFIIYVAATFLWVSLLKEVSLAKAYGFMSLSFVLVPLASVIFFGEKITLSYMTGALFIVIGIVIASRGA